VRPGNWRKIRNPRLRTHQTGITDAILPGLTMGGGDDVAAGDEDAAALVLGEQAQPGGLPDEDLPGEGAEGGALAADDAAGLDMGPHTALC